MKLKNLLSGSLNTRASKLSRDEKLELATKYQEISTSVMDTEDEIILLEAATAIYEDLDMTLDATMLKIITDAEIEKSGGPIESDD